MVFSKHTKMEANIYCTIFSCNVDNRKKSAILCLFAKLKYLQIKVCFYPT